MENVVVTAQRQPFRGDVPIQEMPQSVQVISSEMLQTINVTQLDDVLDLASGVARQNTFGGLWDSFAIRGFAGDENTPTGYLVNGFNAGRGFSGRRDASNIERVEVLKGPGSALYGRSEPGGTINIVTKKPEFEREGSIELAAGRYDTYRVAADFTSPITDSIAFRINGAYEDADSFRDYITWKKSVLTPSLLARIGDATTLSYELELVNQKAPFDRGVVASPDGKKLGLVPVSRFLGEPSDGENEIKAMGHQAVLQHDFSGAWSLLVGLGYRDSSFEGYSSDPELVASRQLYYIDATNVSRQRRFRKYDTSDLSARAEVTGRFDTGSLTHHLLAGIDYYDYELDTLQMRIRPTLTDPYSVNIFDPVYGQTRTPDPFQDQTENQKATGFYLQDQIDLGEHWKFLAGVRYDDFSQDFDFHLTGVSQTNDQTATSPRVGLVYEASKLWSVYASYAEGFRPNTGTDVNGNAFEPEASTSYEIGTKLGGPDDRVYATIALYSAKKDNVLTTDPVNAGFSMTGGKAESKGVEVDVAGRITDDLRFNFAYAYTDAEWSNSVLDPNFALPLPAGTPLINIPKHSGNVFLVQSFRLGGADCSAGIGATYVDERLGETGVPAFQLPSYTLVKLTGSYAPTEHLKFMLDVDNLLDEEYYASSYSRLWVAPGSPRTYTIRGLYSF
jgi:iron complex outermembrane receptor protein